VILGHPSLVIATAVLLGALVGLCTRRQVARLRYRLNTERNLPEPGSRWWIVAAAVLTFLGLGIWQTLTPMAAHGLALLPLAVAGPALAAIDLDVHRLPNRILAPVAIATLAALAAAALAVGEPLHILWAVAAAVATLAVLGALNLATDGIGMGDVKLAGIIAAAVTPLGLSVLWIAIAIGSGLAILHTTATRQRGPIPFGPWLLLGAWAGTLLSLGMTP